MTYYVVRTTCRPAHIRGTGLFALLFTITTVFAGRSHARQIKEFDARKGLGLARAASIGGIAFTILTAILIVAVFTNGDAATRPLL